MDQLRYQQRQLRGNYDMDDYFIGSLYEGDSHYLTADLNGRDTIVITGVCDQDCSDLDLIIRDEWGDVLDRDQLVDDEPVLHFRPPYAGEFEIEVVMYSCDVEPCWFGVALFSD